MGQADCGDEWAVVGCQVPGLTPGDRSRATPLVVVLGRVDLGILGP